MLRGKLGLSQSVALDFTVYSSLILLIVKSNALTPRVYKKMAELRRKMWYK